MKSHGLNFESPLRGSWIAAGVSGHGFTLSPAVGELMTALSAGTKNPEDPAPFAFGRFGGERAVGTFIASSLRDKKPDLTRPSAP